MQTLSTTTTQAWSCEQGRGRGGRQAGVEEGYAGEALGEGAG